MTDETDLSQETKWLYEQRAKTVIKNFHRRHLNGQYVSSRQEALSVVLEMIPPGAVVARGDSVSVDQVGIISELIRRNQNTIINPFERDSEGYHPFSPETKLKMMKEAFLADIFLTGSNAITLDGKLVNTDGRGNRVAPLIFGPEKVIVIASANKIVKDLNEALERIHNFATPINAKRHAMKHHNPALGDLPCVQTGSCVDCSHEWRICRHTVITEGSMPENKERIHVVLVGENLGI